VQAYVVVGEQLGRLGGREAQVAGPDLGQVARGAQPPQPQTGVGAGGDDQVGLRGQPRDQELDLLVARGRLDEVEVVEDEDDVVGSGRQCVQQGRQDRPRGEGAGGTDHAGRLADGQRAPGALQRHHHVGPQPVGVVVPGSKETHAVAWRSGRSSHWASAVVLP
jgi:hypothetical protein